MAGADNPTSRKGDQTPLSIQELFGVPLDTPLDQLDAAPSAHPDLAAPPPPSTLGELAGEAARNALGPLADPIIEKTGEIGADIAHKAAQPFIGAARGLGGFVPGVATLAGAGLEGLSGPTVGDERTLDQEITAAAGRGLQNVGAKLSDFIGVQDLPEPETTADAIIQKGAEFAVPVAVIAGALSKGGMAINAIREILAAGSAGMAAGGLGHRFPEQETAIDLILGLGLPAAGSVGRVAGNVFGSKGGAIRLLRKAGITSEMSVDRFFSKMLDLQRTVNSISGGFIPRVVTVMKEAGEAQAGQKLINVEGLLGSRKEGFKAFLNDRDAVNQRAVKRAMDTVVERLGDKRAVEQALDAADARFAEAHKAVTERFYERVREKVAKLGRKEITKDEYETAVRQVLRQMRQDVRNKYDPLYDAIRARAKALGEADAKVYIGPSEAMGDLPATDGLLSRVRDLYNSGTVISDRSQGGQFLINIARKYTPAEGASIAEVNLGEFLNARKWLKQQAGLLQRATNKGPGDLARERSIAAVLDEFDRILSDPRSFSSSAGVSIAREMMDLAPRYKKDIAFSNDSVAQAIMRPSNVAEGSDLPAAAIGDMIGPTSAKGAAYAGRFRRTFIDDAYRMRPEEAARAESLLDDAAIDRFLETDGAAGTAAILADGKIPSAQALIAKRKAWDPFLQYNPGLRGKLDELIGSVKALEKGTLRADKWLARRRAGKLGEITGMDAEDILPALLKVQDRDLPQILDTLIGRIRRSPDAMEGMRALIADHRFGTVLGTRGEQTAREATRMQVIAERFFEPDHVAQLVEFRKLAEVGRATDILDLAGEAPELVREATKVRPAGREAFAQARLGGGLAGFGGQRQAVIAGTQLVLQRIEGALGGRRGRFVAKVLREMEVSPEFASLVMRMPRNGPLGKVRADRIRAYLGMLGIDIANRKALEEPRSVAPPAAPLRSSSATLR